MVNEIIKASFSDVIPNLPPEAPLGATTRPDSRQNDVGLAVGIGNLY